MSLADAMTAALEHHGIEPGLAALAAQTGVAAFRVAHSQWLGQAEHRSLGVLQRELLTVLNLALTAK